MIRDLWGDPETVSAKVTKRPLELFGHLARMPNQRIPKMALFGWLPKPASLEDLERDGETRYSRISRL